jgi:rhodanese-related sulfurtransferase
MINDQANAVIIDVRERDEYNAERIECSIHVPLSKFQKSAAKVLQAIPKEHPVLMMCRSGKRAKLALDSIPKNMLENRANISVFTGGILEWKKQNRPTETIKAGHFPIMRQVQLIAGILMLTSITLGHWINPSFLFIGVFVGLGLTVAGATGYCGMANLLALAPWNKSKKETP